MPGSNGHVGNIGGEDALTTYVINVLDMRVELINISGPKALAFCAISHVWSMLPAKDDDNGGANGSGPTDGSAKAAELRRLKDEDDDDREDATAHSIPLTMPHSVTIDSAEATTPALPAVVSEKQRPLINLSESQLAAFCRWCREVGGLERVWLDFICLRVDAAGNILDTEIRMMAEVYTRCARVLVLSDGIRGVLSGDTVPNAVWFSRAWTLQEMILPKRIDVAIGAHIVKWQTWLTRLTVSGLKTRQVDTALELKQLVLSGRAGERDVLRASLSRAAARPVDRAIAAFAILDDASPTKTALAAIIAGESRIQSYTLLELLLLLTRQVPALVPEIAYATGSPADAANGSWLRASSQDALSMGGLSRALAVGRVEPDGSLVIENAVVNKILRHMRSTRTLPTAWMVPDSRLPCNFRLPTRWSLLLSGAIFWLISIYYVADSLAGFTRRRYAALMPSSIRAEHNILFNVFASASFTPPLVDIAVAVGFAVWAVGRNATILDVAIKAGILATVVVVALLYIGTQATRYWLACAGLASLGYSVPPAAAPVFDVCSAGADWADALSAVLHLALLALPIAWVVLAQRDRLRARRGLTAGVSVVYTRLEEWLVLASDPTLIGDLEDGRLAGYVVISAQSETRLTDVTPGLLCRPLPGGPDAGFAAVGVCCASGVVSGASRRHNVRIGGFSE
ncbi:hypothetical protein HK405_000037 [Cladochytrium tenue]|nr:hypothetical protein HK405_000037 [Cladochytrium tenue]